MRQGLTQKRAPLILRPMFTSISGLSWFSSSKSGNSLPAVEATAVQDDCEHVTEAETKQKIKQTAALETLRGLLNTSEGSIIANQLVQGGELRCAEELVTEQHLARWLRARDWKPRATYDTLKEHGAWRVRIAPTGCVPDDKIRPHLEAGKLLVQGCDKHGRTLAIVLCRKHTLHSRKLEDMEQLVAYALDAMIAACDPVRNPERRLVAMLDLTGISMANMDVPAVRTLLELLGTHYVERLGTLIFYNPPYIFWGVWNALKGLLPEVTRAKIKMVDPAAPDVLTETVDDDVLPRVYGGGAEMRPLQPALGSLSVPAEEAAAAGPS